MRHEVDRLAQIDGSMPRLTAIPPGCPFHPRCAARFAPCDRERPELMPAGPSLAACWLHDERHRRAAAQVRATLAAIDHAAGEA
jgi:peptide/nickel transport system ATP-binding protein